MPEEAEADSDAVEQEADAEAEGEEEEDLDPELEALLSFAQMDAEAAAAYEIAAEVVGDKRLVEMLRSFAQDHQRHVRDIQSLIAELGAESELAAPDPETSTFASMAETVSQLGPQAAVRALIASEQFTNSAYETAMELIALPEARAVVERNFRDEQRHLQALMQELQRATRMEDSETA